MTELTKVTIDTTEKLRQRRISLTLKNTEVSLTQSGFEEALHTVYLGSYKK